MTPDNYPKLAQFLEALTLLESLSGYVNSAKQPEISRVDLEQTIREQLAGIVPQDKSLRYEDLATRKSALERVSRVIKSQLEPLSGQFSSGFVDGLKTTYDIRLESVTKTLQNRHNTNKEYLKADIAEKIGLLEQLEEGADLPDVPDVPTTLTQLEETLTRLESDKATQKELESVQLLYQQLEGNLSSYPKRDIKEVERLSDKILSQQPKHSAIAIEAAHLKNQLAFLNNRWQLECWNMLNQAQLTNDQTKIDELLRKVEKQCDLLDETSASLIRGNISKIRGSETLPQLEKRLKEANSAYLTNYLNPWTTGVQREIDSLETDVSLIKENISKIRGPEILSSQLDERLKEVESQLEANQTYLGKWTTFQQEIDSLKTNSASLTEYETRLVEIESLKADFDEIKKQFIRPEQTPQDEPEPSVTPIGSRLDWLKKLDNKSLISALAVGVVLIGIVALAFFAVSRYNISFVTSLPTLTPTQTATFTPIVPAPTNTPIRPSVADPNSKTPSPVSPTITSEPEKIDYNFRVCVVWPDAPTETSVEGVTIIETVGDQVNKTHVTSNGSCLQLSGQAAIGEQIQVSASPPQNQNLQIDGQEQNGWRKQNNTLIAVITENMPEARFTVTIPQRTFNGQVILEKQVGIAGIPIKLERKRLDDPEWQSVGEEVFTDDTGNFSIHDTNIGWPDFIYRLSLANLNINRNKYIYHYELSREQAQVSDIWSILDDKALQTTAPLTIGQEIVEGAKFQLTFQYVVLPVDAAIIEPTNITGQDISGTFPENEQQKSKLVTLDEDTVNTLQARWENVALSAGAYRLEIWTPDGANGFADYMVSTSSDLGKPKVSSQQVREKNVWVASSSVGPFWEGTLTSEAFINVVMTPSLVQGYQSAAGQIFGIGPVRLVKQP